MTATKTVWALLFKQGHYYFRSSPDDLIAVADNSMTNRRDPTTSDDGLMLLDRTRLIKFNDNGTCSIPLLRQNERVWTGADWKEGLAVCHHFKLLPSISHDMGALFALLHKSEEV